MIVIAGPAETVVVIQLDCFVISLFAMTRTIQAGG